MSAKVGKISGYMFIATLIALMVGNVLFQYFTTRDYIRAFERSWFQAVALFAVWMNWIVLK